MNSTAPTHDITLETLDPSDKHALNACHRSEPQPASTLHSDTGAVLDNCKKETTHE